MKKSKSIVILSILSILIILGTVFAFVSVPLGRYDYIAFPKTISLGLDLSGGVYAVFDIDETTEEYAKIVEDEKLDEALEGTRAGLESLLFSKGYTEALVTTYDKRIRVEIPDVDDPERVFELIGKPATIEFKEYVDGKEDKSLNDSTGSVKLDHKLTGDYVEDAGVQYDSSTGYYVVALKFNTQGTEDFSTTTSALVGKQLAIWVNNAFLIAPKVNETISGGQCSISGNYSYDDAYALAVQIQAGSFPLTLKMSESNTISATLGSDAIKAGVIGGLVGLVLIIIYMCALYRLMGVAASLSLMYYALTYIFFLAIFPWVQLTLSGIAGVLLSIGMAVDANVIIFERIKEEYASGKTLRTSISTGFKRSYGAILDGNITTIIGSIVLIIVGASSIKSFGITLLIGIIISLLSSLLLTRLILSCITAFNHEEDAYKFALKKEETEENVDVIDVEPVKEV